MSRMIVMKKLFKLKKFISTQTNSILKNTLIPGDKIHNYTVNRVVPIKELNLVSTLLVHKTGAEHLHVARNDQDNVFTVAFKTIPYDSTGVPHILEHISLCGSKKFPIKDPFFKMLNRSLSTFMNAMTSYDVTLYPFSTQNEKDFRNLLMVYLDAVFYPRLRKFDFLQEGWRLENENLDDIKSNMSIKGVVYNEMKGIYSDPHQIYIEKAKSLLHPQGTYSMCSGGDPLVIPNLTWKELKSFHQKHYHPSNSKFFTYGNIPLEQHLKLIDENYLSHFHHSPVNTTVTPQARWTLSKDVSITCPPDIFSPDIQADSIISANYLLCDVTDNQEVFELSVLGELLSDGEQSPFYQSLIESGLGPEYSPNSGFNTYTRDVSFSIGLQRVHIANQEKVKDAIIKTMEQVASNGLDEKRIQSVLHKIELSLKHQTESFGLKLIMSMVTAWNHAADPIDFLQVSKRVSKLKHKLSLNPQHFQDLVKKYFLENNHVLFLKSNPDQSYLKKQLEKEKKKIEGFVKSLSENKKQEIFVQGKELFKNQSEKEDFSCLPSLQLSEIPQKYDEVSSKRYKLYNYPSPSGSFKKLTFPVHVCEQPTNGVVYLRLVSSADLLPDYLIPYLPFFCHVVSKVGAGRLDYKTQSEFIKLKTGGLDAFPLFTSHPTDFQSFQKAVCFSSFCLERNFDYMIQLWIDIFVSLNLLDKERFMTLLTSFAAETSASLSGLEHQFAMTKASSSLSLVSQLNEKLSGTEQLNFLKSLVLQTKDNMEKVEEVLKMIKEIADHVLLSSVGNIRASLNCESKHLENSLKMLEKFYKDLDSLGIKNDFSGKNKNMKIESSNDILYSKSPFEPSSFKVHKVLPLQLNHLALCYPTVPLAHNDQASLKILSKLISSKFLHERIREKGGAYGSGAQSDPNVFKFFSYRDPNFSETFKVFKDSIEWVENNSFSDIDIKEAKLAIFSQVDKPEAPGNKNMKNFLKGVTEKEFSSLRQKLLSVERKDILLVCDKYLKKSDKSSIAALGPKNNETVNWSLE